MDRFFRCSGQRSLRPQQAFVLAVLSEFVMNSTPSSTKLVVASLHLQRLAPLGGLAVRLSLYILCTYN
jgi:hypothetical protein